jgi:hypothetical protein
MRSYQTLVLVNHTLFHHEITCSVCPIFSNGSPGTATTSTSLPASSAPVRLAIPSNSASAEVPAVSASMASLLACDQSAGTQTIARRFRLSRFSAFAGRARGHFLLNCSVLLSEGLPQPVCSALSPIAFSARNVAIRLRPGRKDLFVPYICQLAPQSGSSGLCSGPWTCPCNYSVRPVFRTKSASVPALA